MIDYGYKNVDYNTRIRMNIKRPKGESHLMKIPVVEGFIAWKFVVKVGTPNHYFFLKEFTGKPGVKLEQYLATSLSFDIGLNFPITRVDPTEHADCENENWETLVRRSNCPIIHWQTNVVKYFLELPQLRHEFLILYNIRPFHYSPTETVNSPGNPKTSPNLGTHPDKSSGHFFSSPPRKSNEFFDSNLTDPGQDLPSVGSPGVPNPGQNDDSRDQPRNQQAMFSNYMELLANALNEQTNMPEKKHQNLLLMISEVKFKFSLSSTRLVITNTDNYYNLDAGKNVMPSVNKTKKKQKKTEMGLGFGPQGTDGDFDRENFYDHNDNKGKSILGLQLVFDSFVFRSIFYKKEIKVVSQGPQAKASKNMGSPNSPTINVNMKKIYVWSAKEGMGRINMVYGGNFDGKY